MILKSSRSWEVGDVGTRWWWRVACFVAMVGLSLVLKETNADRQLLVHEIHLTNLE